MTLAACCECWGSNPGPLEKQDMLLNAEPSLQLLNSILNFPECRGAGAMALWLRPLAALSEDLDPILSTNMEGHNHLKL